MPIKSVIARGVFFCANALYEKAVSPSADLTPVYLGGLCHFVKIGLDEYQYKNGERVVGVAALVFTGILARSHGLKAFSCIVELMTRVASDRAFKWYVELLKNNGSPSLGETLAFGMVQVVLSSLSDYSMQPWNPTILLKTRIPLNIAFISFKIVRLQYEKDIETKIQECFSKKYGWDISRILINGAFLLLGHASVKVIGSRMKAPIPYHGKMRVVWVSVCTVAELLLYSENSPLTSRR